VRLNFVNCLERLFERGARVGIATHDEYLITAALGLIRKLAVPKENYEFQMLLGVTEGQRRQLVKEGHAMRVYIPYGRDWYAYSVRRLRENPKIAVYVTKAMFGIK
jgi:proline dehydrogenase